MVILFWSLSLHCEHWEVGNSELLWEWQHGYFCGIDFFVVIFGTEILSAWIGPMLADVVEQLTHWTLGLLSIVLTGRRNCTVVYVTLWCTGELYWPHVDIDIYPVLLAMVTKSGKWNCGWCSLWYELTHWLLSWITIDWILATQVSVLNCGFGLRDFAHLPILICEFWHICIWIVFGLCDSCHWSTKWILEVMWMVIVHPLIWTLHRARHCFPSDGFLCMISMRYCNVVGLRDNYITHRWQGSHHWMWSDWVIWCNVALSLSSLMRTRTIWATHITLHQWLHPCWRNLRPSGRRIVCCARPWRTSPELSRRYWPQLLVKWSLMIGRKLRQLGTSLWTGPGRGRRLMIGQERNLRWA